MSQWVWHGGVVLTVAVLLAVTWGIGWVLWTGEMGDALRGDPDGITFRTHPIQFVVQLAMAVGLWFTILRYARRGIEIWRYRNTVESQAYRQALARHEKAGSPFGNALAWILLVPFVLIGLMGVLVFFLR